MSPAPVQMWQGAPSPGADVGARSGGDGRGAVQGELDPVAAAPALVAKRVLCAEAERRQIAHDSLS